MATTDPPLRAHHVPPTTTDPRGIAEVIRGGQVTSVFQPIVDLRTGRVVACEALARGPAGPWESPTALFAAARESGLLTELDEACRTSAVRGAVAAGLVAPLTLFVNVEPEVLDRAPLGELRRIAERAPGQLRVVLEITERALAERPAELLQTVARVRQLGWGVALDDVGADAMSIAFMPLLRPDVVKLDLRLVQDRPGPAVAEVMNAVNAYAEDSGALVVAEGVETTEHLAVALALGATLGQGWLFGRPAPAPPVGSPDRWEVSAPGLPLPDPEEPVEGSSDELGSPFDLLPASATVRQGSKRLLLEVTKQIEREALRLGDSCIVASAFQHARHFTPTTAQRYRDLVASVGFVCALGDEVPAEPVAGLRGASLALADPLRDEWDVVVLSPHFAVALLARDLGDDVPEAERGFEFALTYRRDTVVAAARALVSRVAPRVSPPPAVSGTPPRRSRAQDPPPPAGTTPGPEAAGSLLERALGATASGVCIVDMTVADQPLVFVNRAFEQLSGLPTDQLLGRNCRFLQGPGTDHAAVTRVRAAVAAGRECRETLLNHRGPDRTPWWNEVHLAPVVDRDGAVLQYIGVQHDVTARVEAELELQRERDRSSRYLSRIERLAWTDPLTGLSNRRRFQDDLETLLWAARADGTAVALLFLDLDGFKAVNDTRGHAAGDELLVHVARRIDSRLRHSDLCARLGGDEFLVALPGLRRGHADAEAAEITRALLAAVAEPADVGGGGGGAISITAAAGTSVFPDDGDDFRALLHESDRRMYATKRQLAADRP
ncbi:PAS domain S-box-containing protein/diguanylate cyclase (GGDEF) domain-containing protein [Klenkia soli]|uniref:PAS domain S-box-containing protein/diguanylate cyclase (GGDEF) domain-containing protein n=1 Tax=Klenkia soli TaxID=1052260 RepID=A0A1H0SJ88_9ACTN|nr:EAL domain-containing protein [Klenkia soli]SDP41813.1 PAS domain S-box-containing protein/diguanylate cyclase (GGDEF) domain-containing protein [Klenkia soli]